MLINKDFVTNVILVTFLTFQIINQTSALLLNINFKVIYIFAVNVILI